MSFIEGLVSLLRAGLRAGHTSTHSIQCAEGWHFIPAAEDWYPSFDGGLVATRITALRDGNFRVSVWGDDDFGMVRDVPTEEEARRIYLRLPSVIFKDDLVSMGFERF